MAATPQAAAVIGVLNKVIKYAIGLGAGASALQTSLYNGEACQRAVAELRGLLLLAM
jgi:prohibitin 1